MKCAVHSEVDATGYCRNCGKALCPMCARPVREVLYCENCLATGMGMPATASPPPPVQDPYTAPAYIAPPVAAVPPPQPGGASGAIAFVLGLFPGLGAVYNGEYNKALVHVVVFAALIFGLANSDELSDGAIVTLSLMLAGFIFYMAFDSMRVAQAKSAGRQTTPDPLESIGRNLPLGPVILVGIGALMLLNNFRVFDILHLSLGRMWPLILIGAGILMFRNRAGRS